MGNRERLQGTRPVRGRNYVEGFRVAILLLRGCLRDRRDPVSRRSTRAGRTEGEYDHSPIVVADNTLTLQRETRTGW